MKHCDVIEPVSLHSLITDALDISEHLAKKNIFFKCNIHVVFHIVCFVTQKIQRGKSLPEQSLLKKCVCVCVVSLLSSFDVIITPLTHNRMLHFLGGVLFAHQTRALCFLGVK